VIPEFLIAVSTSLQLLLGGASPLPAQPVEVAQAAAPAAVAAAARDTDRAMRRVRGTLAERQRVVVAKGKLAKRYEAELQEIDRLKKRRASWRRDNAIKSKKRESQARGLELAKLDKRIRQLDARARKERAALVRAIDRELKSGAVASARRGELERTRRSTRRALQRNKKIVLPDDTIDPLADPEELEYQAERIAQSEARLSRELSSLVKRAKRFRKMAKLDQKRRRAREAGKWDDNRPRRTSRSAVLAGSRGGAGYGDGDDSQNEGMSPAPNDEPDSDMPGALGVGEADDFSDATVVLVDVVDAQTIDALRNAEASGSLLVKAKAAERAHRQVREQLERLEKRRKLIEKRARRLRRP